MELVGLEIENFRSFDKATLDHLGKFNVFIGRNNSGKSTLIQAIATLAYAVGAPAQPIDWQTVLPIWNQDGRLTLAVTFRPTEAERTHFITLLRDAGLSTNRIDSAVNSPLCRQVRFVFASPPGAPHLLHLRETRLMTEDGQWAAIQKMDTTNQNEMTSNPQSVLSDLDQIASRNPTMLGVTQIEVGSQTPNTGINFQVGVATIESVGTRPATKWPHLRLLEYFRSAFFFSPFRHISPPRQQVKETPRLSADGANLAQVLHTINSGDRELFNRIEQFVQDALPGIGRLQSPLIGTETEVGFRTATGSRRIRLDDMGGGIEQLLMIATVLLSTGDESTLMLEEPESHIHPGAQRFLVDQLYRGQRQIFIATHSPVFLNVSQPKTIHRVEIKSGRSQVQSVVNPEALGGVLDDIGVRNSDVLLSDAVLFVEGPSDRDCLTAWSKTLKIPLADRNVSIVPMGGGAETSRGLPLRSDVLAAVSQKSPVPHLFLLDRDERRKVEIEKLGQMLGDRVHIWQARELENYLLDPTALLAALSQKYRDSGTVLEKLKAMSEKDIERMLHEAANGLLGLVLIKRVRAELGGLPDGLLTREAAGELATLTDEPDLDRLTLNAINKNLANRLERADIAALLKEEKANLDHDWSIESRQLEVAPGEEIINDVFRQFGGTYEKPQDTLRISRAMAAKAIPNEVRDVLQRASSLSSA